MAKCVKKRICSDRCRDRWYCGKPFQPLDLRFFSEEEKQKSNELLKLKLEKEKKDGILYKF